ncbi:alpha/beta fold hydrolase [Thiohalorhabdus denitrificans]|uniref:Pimeloyl-[acyl-carrier protein] methyl ester esterase n=1 Tax=Thiohalorhabdus denitrificans TaxID=381306 RepID=A0A1G5BQY1_9GAMM|nr:alpha/beta fold hydrolase [Thiohalorhabdus denitrificans]SCX92454.1 pimeloyl-[acyl-carrier protein] methyl ester esterase [Thiohalorhabdus denitrificans]
MSTALRALAVAGWGHTPACWERLQPEGVELTGNALPGHAAAEGEPVPGGPDLRAAANALAGDWGLLLGWSLGGLAALEAVRSGAVRPRGLVLLATPPSFLARATYPAGLDSTVFRRFRDGLDQDPAGTLRRFYALQFQGDRAARSAWAPTAIRDRLLAAGTAPSVLTGWLEVLGEADLTAEPPRLDLPVLVLHGSGDAVVDPAAVEFFLGCGPGVRAHIVRGAGHAPQITHPEETGQQIAGFARDLAP